MTSGQKSIAVRRWNRGHKIPQIAKYIGVSEDELKAYFMTRTGFPGHIECLQHGRMPKPARPAPPPRPRVQKLPRRPDGTVPVTLPRLKFLERAELDP